MTVLYLKEKSYVQSLSFLLLENSAIFFQNKRGMNIAQLLWSEFIFIRGLHAKYTIIMTNKQLPAVCMYLYMSVYVCVCVCACVCVFV